MLRNYFKTAFRSLSRNKVFSFINIAGLSIGLACCILIFLYAKDEISYDQFQEKKDQLYQLTCRIIKKQGGEDKYALGAMVQGPTFQREIPEIREFVRVSTGDILVKKGNETFSEKMSWVDDNFFSVFSFPLLTGDPGKVLSDPHSMVITDEMARKYFGTTNALGKTLEMEVSNNKFEPFVVSGVAKRSPQNSSIRFGILLPFKYHEKLDPENGWLWLSYSTFFVVQPGAKPSAIAEKMAKVFQSKAGAEVEEAKKKEGFDDKFVWGIRPFLSMHLDTEYQSDSSLGTSNPIYSYILSGLPFLFC